MIRRPPRSPLFPSTPLFRSFENRRATRRLLFAHSRRIEDIRLAGRNLSRRYEHPANAAATLSSQACASPRRDNVRRSEEHTSELQSQSNLVCRLLLDKKTTT